MISSKHFLITLFYLILFIACDDKDNPPISSPDFTLTYFSINNVQTNASAVNVSRSPQLKLYFSEPLNLSSAQMQIVLKQGFTTIPCQYSLTNNDSAVLIVPQIELHAITSYSLFVDAALLSKTSKEFGTYLKYSLVTELDLSDKFPRISDNALLDSVQHRTFKYFYNFAHPASGMARERNSSGNTVTSGGSGFGIMALIVGMERNFITRTEGVNQMKKIVSFLETADRFHGAWSHWIDGNTGNVIPFSTKDNGGDLVETSFLVQGLLTFRQYLEPTDTVGNNLINRITTLWETVEWDWYRKNNSNVLYWHWSPNYNWDMNFALSGYFEEQITYVLAAASPTHSIPKEVYSNGYGKNGAIVKNNMYYNIKLPLESPAPLFWVQYSYLGLDPHFSDDYANYWEQNVNATLINRAYCIANPKKYIGYSEDCWGLTASDNQDGYNAHSPGNDLGVITPTAALSSFPYTPIESMQALKFFYYTIGDRMWGPYGFYDAFNLTEGWTATSTLAIDQGPIIVMIENYRTGLLWDLFMSAPEVNDAFTKLNFTK
ncbi:MAG: glucoamylase family protein [Chryseolinea sp.]